MTLSRYNSGSVLIVVLWACLALVAVALYFGHASALSYRASSNSAGALQAAQAMAGARRYVTFILDNLEEPATLPDTEEYTVENGPVGDARFWLVGRDDTYLLEQETPAFGLMDEGARLNLNTATREMLEGLPEMTPELAGAIIDWRDEDEEISADGAESETYLLHDPAYNAKNAAFESVEELRLVNGATLELLYGEDTNLNGILDPNEDDGDESYPNDDANGELKHGLVEYLTVWAREPNKREDGSDRVNLGQDSQSLEQLLGESLDGSRAQSIIQAVQPFLNSIQSPLEFYIRSGLTAEEFAEIDDAITVSEDAYLEGLVNVNTAPAEVLSCLPGIDEGMAEQLVSYRIDIDEDKKACLAWVMDVLEEDAAITAGPYLTTRTYVYRADFVALGFDGHGYQRDLVIFDLAGGETVIPYRRDLTRFGWPLGPESYEQLTEDQGLEEFDL